MKQYLIGGAIGLVVGGLLFGVMLSNMAPEMMILEDETKYSNFNEAVETFTRSVEDHGWKMPTVHDLQKTMKKMGKTDVRAVKVFELCHPDHAHKILTKDQERVVTSLMPCRVAIYERSDGKVYVSRMNSGLMASFMDGVVPEVMDDASRENEEILQAILK